MRGRVGYFARLKVPLIRVYQCSPDHKFGAHGKFSINEKKVELLPLVAHVRRNSCAGGANGCPPWVAQAPLSSPFDTDGGETVTRILGHRGLWIAALAFGIFVGHSSQALGQFTNGGFETGNFTGWSTSGTTNVVGSV